MRRSWCGYTGWPKKLYIFTARCYASAVLAMGLCLCLSQVGVLLKQLNESGWFLARELHSTYLTLCYKEIHVPLKIRVLTSLWNFAPNSGLRKFRNGISIVEACYQLSSRKVDAQNVINWAVVGQLSL